MLIFQTIKHIIEHINDFDVVVSKSIERNFGKILNCDLISLWPIVKDREEVFLCDFSWDVKSILF